MAVQGSAVKFVYLKTGTRPANPDENTIYFAPASQSIYVGSIPVINGIETANNFNHLNERVDQIDDQIADMTTAIEVLESKAITVEITGSGTDIVDASFDDTNNVLTITKGDPPPIIWEVVGSV